MRRSWVPCGLRCLVSGVKNVVARALLDKVYPSDVSIIVEAEVKLWVCIVASKDICCKFRNLSCCCIQRKMNLVGYLLNYVWLHYLDSSKLHLINVQAQIILNVSLVFMSNPSARMSLIF